MSSRFLLSVLPFVVLVALTVGFVVVFRQRAGIRRAAGPPVLADPEIAPGVPRTRRSSRPWWGNPWLWLGVCAAFLVLGLVVWPGLIGGTVVFLPFVWVWRPRRVVEPDPRSNGHGSSTGRSRV